MEAHFIFKANAVKFYPNLKPISRVNRLVTEHIVSQSPLSHSMCLLSSCGLKINCSQGESAPMGIETAQKRSKLRKYTPSKFGGVKID